MEMQKFVTFYILLLGTSVTPLYLQGGECEGRFRKFLIPINKSAVKTDREYPLGGKRFALNDFANLIPGRYLYLIDEYGDVIWGPAIPDTSVDPSSSNPLLNSHRSLFAKAKFEFPDRNFVGAGEFIIIFYREKLILQEFNNRSGTLPGALANLELARDILAECGLPFSSSTRLLDYSRPDVEPDQHLTKEYIAMAILRYQNDGNFSVFKNFIDQLRLTYPDSEKIGDIDVKRVGEQLLRLRERHKSDVKLQGSLWATLIGISKINDWGPENVYASLLRNGMTPDRIVEIIILLTDTNIFKN